MERRRLLRALTSLSGGQCASTLWYHSPWPSINRKVRPAVGDAQSSTPNAPAVPVEVCAMSCPPMCTCCLGSPHPYQQHAMALAIVPSDSSTVLQHLTRKGFGVANLDMSLSTMLID
jgi:hypothetical protein